MGFQNSWGIFYIHSYADKLKKKEGYIFQIVYEISLGPGLLFHNKIMEVHSSAIIRISVRSQDQGLQISHLSLNSNYQTVFLEWDGYGAKLQTPDLVWGQEIN